MAQARDLRKWLWKRPEKEIVLVSHGGFLYYLTEDWTDNARFSGTGWDNCEIRSYQFEPEDGNSAPIVETEESCRRRSDSSRPL